MRLLSACVLLSVLTACGGGGGGVSAPPPVTSRPLTVTVQGLADGDTLSAANGSQMVVFAGNGTRTLTLDVGAAYDVSLSTSPFESCSAANLAGTVGSAPLAGAEVKCAPQTFIGSLTENLVAATLADGLLYVADRTNNQVHVRRRSDGVQVLTIGQRGVTGNVNGPAAQARFVSVGPLAWSPAIGVVMADTCNHTLRVLGAEVRTLAGQPIQGAMCDASGQDDINVASKDGQGADAVFGRIWDIAAAPDGSIWVLDGSSLRRVAPDGTVTTLGSSAVLTDYGASVPARYFALGADGAWYGVAANALTAVDRNGGQQLVLSYGVTNKWSYIGNLRVGPSGDVYTCVSGAGIGFKPVIVRYSPTGTELKRYPVTSCAFAIEGSGADETPIAAAPLGTPVSAFAAAIVPVRAGVMPDGRVILNQSNQDALVAISGTATQAKVAPFGAKVTVPGHVLANDQGNVAVLSFSTPRVVTVFDAAGSVQRTVPVDDEYANDFAFANDGRIAVAALGGANLFTANGPDPRMIRLPQREGGQPQTESLAFDKDGMLYIMVTADYLHHYLFRVSPDGAEVKEINALSGSIPMSLVAASNGKLYMLMDDAVWQIEPAGALTRTSFQWQGPALPGLEPSAPRITSLATRGAWLYGVHGEGVVRVKLP